MKQYVVFLPAAVIALLAIGVGVLGWFKPTGQETAPRVNERAVALGVGLAVVAALAWLVLMIVGQ